MQHIRNQKSVFSTVLHKGLMNWCGLLVANMCKLELNIIRVRLLALRVEQHQNYPKLSPNLSVVTRFLSLCLSGLESYSH